MHTYPCSCINLPQQNYCSTIITYDHYAPGTLWISANPHDLNDEIQQIDELAEFTMCGDLLHLLNCVIGYPACRTNTYKLIPICRSQCTVINLQIRQCILCMEMNTNSSDYLLAKNLLNSFECDDPKTYYNFPLQYVETNSDDCITLSKFYNTLYIVTYVVYGIAI